MGANGLKEFKEILKNIRELGSLAITGTVAAPLLNVWLRFGPPPTAAIAVLTSGMQFMAVMWAFHFWRGMPKKDLNRKMKLCVAFFVLGLIVSGFLIEQYTISPGPNRDNIVGGYELRSDVQPMIGPNYTPLDALHESQYDASQVWTRTSITAIHLFLATSWIATFVSIAMFISAFVILHRAPQRIKKSAKSSHDQR
jgi:hypothetical protein